MNVIAELKHTALEQDAERLLVLTSRPDLSSQQAARAKELAGRVTNWSAVIDVAARKFSVNMVFQNLHAHAAYLVPSDIIDEFHIESFRVTKDILRRKAAFDWFHRTCVDSAGVDYAYFKGPALAARFYSNPMQRFYRDIDILVPKEQRIIMLETMVQNGCRVFENIPNDPKFIDLGSSRELREVDLLTTVPHLITPQGLVIEVHSEVDPYTSLFRTENLLRDAQITRSGDLEIKVIPDAEHIVFSCYHHTSHLWSKLNWLADLHCFFERPDFDKEAVVSLAHRMTLDSTVLAAMELHQLAKDAQHPTDFSVRQPGVDLLTACIDGFGADSDLELKMRAKQRFRMMSFKWQPSPVSRFREVILVWRSLAPRYYDVHGLRGSFPLRFIKGLFYKFNRVAARVFPHLSFLPQKRD